MDNDLDQWFAEYRRLNAALGLYYDRISAIMDSKRRWKRPPTEPEEVIDGLIYFYEAGLVNEGDVFGYMHCMIEQRKALEAIGAKGCLAALEALMPYYEEQQQLATDDKKREYWHRTRCDRQQAELLAEDVNEFARLMLAYAQQHDSEIGSVTA
jgi:hypothetical protein